MMRGSVKRMKREVAIGVQDFEKIRANNRFYVDKTELIREWWKGCDDVTLITRPRRFGKTLNMSTLNCFFSNKYENREDLFKDLKIWEDTSMREQQGKWPVIFVSFAEIKAATYEETLVQMKKTLTDLYLGFPELYRYEGFEKNDQEELNSICKHMSDTDAAYSLKLLSRLLKKIYGKKVLIFLDEYDTPLQEAYINGYWDKLTAFTRSMFNSTFKTNLSLERGIMTGITRVSKESIFSDLNNLKVVTTTSDLYADCFGFTEKEVFRALEDQGFTEKDKWDVKTWYDGFTFGTVTDMYNPWSITNFLDEKKLAVYWANTSSNGLVGTLLRHGSPDIKKQFEILLRDEYIEVSLDEQIVFNQLDRKQNALWSLLLAAGYLKIIPYPGMREPTFWEEPVYRLAITNLEVWIMFRNLVREWFEQDESMPSFVQAMLRGNVEEMNYYMNRIALQTFSSFDTGNHPGGAEPERFYHGFVLGLMAEKAKDYYLRSNRESGLGRYDVMMEPKDSTGTAVIMEFKVQNEAKGETTLEDTAANALKQIEEKRYDTELISHGIPADQILKYALAFRGKECLIRKAV
jgi:hypothetical protein